MAEDLGEDLAQYGFGPAGALTFRATKTTIDISLAAAGSHISEGERQKLLSTYDAMARQFRYIKEKVENLTEDIEQYCLPGT